MIILSLGTGAKPSRFVLPFVYISYKNIAALLVWKAEEAAAEAAPEPEAPPAATSAVPVCLLPSVSLFFQLVGCCKYRVPL